MNLPQKNHPLSFPDTKNFIGRNITLTINFYRQGGLDVEMVEFPRTTKLRSTGTGLFTVEVAKLTIAFSLGSRRSDFGNESETMCIGNVSTNKRNREYMILQWLSYDEASISPASCMRKDKEILFLC